MEKAYSPQEVAKQLGLSPQTVYRLIKRGEIRAAEIGGQYRISESEYKRLLTTDSNGANE
jgi:putative molybdopterin biosynthesis protein